jgi:putative oxidoreductase
MSTNVSVPKPARWKAMGFWTLKIVFALAFFGAAAFKFSGAAPAVAEFDQIGLGQWFRYFTGACEFIGAGLLLVPVTSGFGAILLTCVSIGAFLTQLLALHGDVIHTFIFIGAMGGIAWATRDQVLGRLGLASL